MTKKSTIASVNERVTQLANSFADQMSTLRYGVTQYLGISHKGNRDLYDVYGYPKTLSGFNGFNMMYQYSRREGISNRITAGVAKTCWREGFEVFKSAEDDAEQVLVDEVEALRKAGFIKKIEAADTLNRIGRLSVLYVGVPDGRKPEEELGIVTRGADFLGQLYFVAYAYDGVTISEQEDDITSPRYGLPKFYQLQRIGRNDNEKDTSTKSIKAHWSRVIHLNENSLESDIEGMGVLEPVFNRILDIDKATGGASEAYFRNAKGKIAYEIDKEFAALMLEDQTAKDKFQEGAEKYTNEFQDHTVAAGSTVKSLPTPHASPVDTVKTALWAISGYTGIPIRVLTGEGAGQLAGSEDQLALNQIIKDRQNLICSGWVIRLFEILEQAGMLSLPEDYQIRFPVQEAATEEQKGRNGDIKATTLQKVVAALDSPAGNSIDMGSALAACNLEEIEFTDIDFDLEEAEEVQDLEGEPSQEEQQELDLDGD